MCSLNSLRQRICKIKRFIEYQRPTQANFLVQSSEREDGRENLLEVVQQNLCSKFQRRTRCPVLLLMYNASWHLDVFKRDNINVVFFIPNCTCWKQSCDMGIIIVFQKKYKYLCLKYIIDIYKSDKELKQPKIELEKLLN